MLDRHAIAGAWSRLREGRGTTRRPTRHRRRRAWGVEVLEGRALLSVYLVNKPGDAGTGSGYAGDLRYAIEQADQETGNSVILFAPSLYNQKIALSTGMLSIDKPSGTLAILGPGAGSLSISGGKVGEVMDIAPGSQVTISGLTITGGFWSQGPGAGIENDGRLTLEACTITGNTAFVGGGGIANGPSGTMTITDSTVSGNVALGSDGGGIANAGTMTILDSTVSGNGSRGGNGGGITNTGNLSILDSTVSGNRATIYLGGGIYNAGLLNLADDTISDNSAGFEGGGIANEATLGGRIVMNNTIVADNVSGIDSTPNDILDDADQTGWQLTGSNDLVRVGDVGKLSRPLVGLDPLLGPLQNNGGPTWTQAIAQGSPAEGAGNPALVPGGVTADQRGAPYSRVVQGHLDIGAFEIQTGRGGLPTPPVTQRAASPAIQVRVGLTVILPGLSRGTNSSTGGSTAGRH